MMREFIKKKFPALIPIVRYFRGNKGETLMRKSLESTLKLAIQKPGSRTSVSDDGYYPLVCYLASKYDEVFKNFRRNYIYNRIIGSGGSQEAVYHMLKLIREIPNFKLTINDWREFAKNDLYGNQETYQLEIDGEKIILSGCTVRYTKFLGDIISMFDTEKIKTVAEIGGGYGGLCRLVMNRLPIESYTLFDLPEALGLAEKYLNHYDECRKNVRYIDGGHIYVNDNYDFFMSHYAFSELRRAVQDMYIEKVLSKSRSGYITWNLLSEKMLDGYSVDEFMKIIPGSKRIEIDYWGNCMIVWGNK